MSECAGIASTGRVSSDASPVGCSIQLSSLRQASSRSRSVA